MRTATIAFLDLVKFSSHSTETQRRLIEGLCDAVRPLIGRWLEACDAVALPTGDGFAVAFLDTEGPSWQFRDVLQLVVDSHAWAQAESTDRVPVALRGGLHIGPVEIITDINSRRNICGHTVNMAQRVMDAASPGQVLVSAEAAGQIFGQAGRIALPTAADGISRSAAVGEPVQIIAKHGVPLLVHAMRVCPPEPELSTAPPADRDILVVGLTELPKSFGGVYGERLSGARDVALIQLTGSRLIGAISSGAVVLSESLRSLKVFMPSIGAFSTVDDDFGLYTARLDEATRAWKSLLTGLRATRPRLLVKLGLFTKPPYFGASFLDWDRPGGTIHVSPYIWNVDAGRCPGYDLAWLGKRPTQIYEAYVDGLRYLELTTPNALES